ncbi:MAG: hypothetical protein ABSE73_08270 [Planctomycetota bacterium]
MSKHLSVGAVASAVLMVLVMSGCGDSGTGTSGGGSTGGSSGGASGGDAERKAEDAKWTYREASALHKEMEHRYAAAKEGQEKFTLWPPYGPEVQGGANNEDVKKLCENMAQFFPDHLELLADKYEKAEPNGPHSDDFKKMLADPELPKLKELKAKVLKAIEEQKLVTLGPNEIPIRMQYETGKALMFYELLPMVEDEKGTPKPLTEDQRKEALALYGKILRMIRSAIDGDRMAHISCVPDRYQREPYQKALDHVIAVLKPDEAKPRDTKRTGQ